MKHAIPKLTTLALLWSGAAFAAPVLGLSELEILHDYTVNSGSVPEGIRLSIRPGSLELSGAAASSVDDPGAVTVDTPFVQISDH